MSSNASEGTASFSLVTDSPGLRSDVAGTFQFGDNSADAAGLPEFTLKDGDQIARGHLTWDPGYARARSPFLSTCMIRMELSPEKLRWAVGTSDFLELSPRPYRHISKVQVVSHARGGILDRVVQWDALNITFTTASGDIESYESSCLPRVSTCSKFRKAASALSASVGEPNDQYAEIVVRGSKVTGLSIRGQVTMRTAASDVEDALLAADDLWGGVLVFTDERR